jgi:DNA-binding MarR family transcriptional regulator
MQDATDQIIELLIHWKAYVQTQPSADIASFARWVLEKEQKQQSDVTLYQSDIRQFIPETESDDLQNAEMSMLWGQIDGYRAMIFKYALRPLDIHSIDEYTLLLFIELHENPSKKEYVLSSLLEPTTAFEMIKRLKRKGFIGEQENPSDRRSLLMLLTEEGEKRLQQAKTTLVQINRLMYAGLSVQDKSFWISELQKMIVTVSKTLATVIREDGTT